MRRGVRQGCPLHPYLSNFFIEEAVTKIKNKTKSIRIKGMCISCIRFADNIVIIGESAGEMENMLRNLSEALEKLKLKIKKRKTMVVGKEKDNVKVYVKVDDTL